MKLSSESISMTFGGLNALTDVDIEVESGRIAGLIGPNGAGKSTLLSILAGEQRPTAGKVLFNGSEITRLNAVARSRMGIARTFQNLRLFREMSVFENVAVASRAWKGERKWIRFGGSGRRNEVAGHASRLLEEVGLDREVWGRQAGGLPYIQQRLLEIARCLATEPKFLLLDEPAAGANDPERVALSALIEEIAASGVGVIVIEHDMNFLFGLAEFVFVLDHGELISHGTSTEIQNDQRVIDAYLGVAEET
ncbi:MAG: ABC transporter ATP-binding protein [Cryobacterium sp.]|nr:ABC transporter ATP-binding protein [Cryobacterium sp.]